MRHISKIIGMGVALAACESAPPTAVTPAAETPLGAEPDAELPAPHLRRLTASQYRNSIADLFGQDIVLPTALEPDQRDAGLLSIGAATTSLSPRGVEQYEDAAFLIAEQVLDHADLRARVIPCTAAAPDDGACAAEVVTALGLRAWRRPLTALEIETLAGLITDIGASADDFDTGVLYGILAIIQAPQFLYRVELGAEGPDGTRALDDYELATRLSYLLWNTTPDDTLLLAAESGELSTDEGLMAHAQRMLASDRTHVGVRTFFTEALALDLLDDATKDPLLFVQASPDLLPDAREQSLRDIESLVLVDDGDYRTLFTNTHTWVSPRLAALYGVPAPDLDGWGLVELDSADGRRGLLGQASFLLLNAHTVSTSATLRGKYVRERLLCQIIPPPPPDVDATIPESDADSPTLRERVAVHLTEPTCAGCHLLMDPIGLGFENFDAIGRWRDTENGATIDPSGELDGTSFANPWALSGVVSNHPMLGPCLARTMYTYALGHALTDGESDVADWLGEALAADDHSVQSLMLRIIASPAFRQVGELDQ
jgi:hypothetical protein